MGFLTFLEYLDPKESTTPNLAVFYSNLLGFVSNHLGFYSLLFSLLDFMIFIFFNFDLTKTGLPLKTDQIKIRRITKGVMTRPLPI
jgi:hypothetical protein